MSGQTIKKAKDRILLNPLNMFFEGIFIIKKAVKTDML